MIPAIARKTPQRGMPPICVGREGMRGCYKVKF